MVGVRSHARSGLTLLEVVLAMGLLVVLSSMTYWFYASSLDTRRVGMQHAQRLRLMRVTLDRLATEIRQASTITTGNLVGIRGDAEQISLLTLRTPSREVIEKPWRGRDVLPPSEYDLLKVSYHIVRHPDIRHEDGYELPLGLARTEVRVPRPDVLDSGELLAGEDAAADEEAIPLDAFEEALFGEEDQATGLGPVSEINWEELYSSEIRYLRFCFFDGNKWWDAWDVPGDNPLPQLVMVTMGFNGCAPCGEELGRTPNEEFCECLNQEPVDCEPLAPDQYSRVVRVTQADPLFRSRITREGQALVEEAASAEGDEEGAE